MKYPEPPTVVTYEPENITTNTAFVSGKILSSGSGSVSRSGINIYPMGDPLSKGPVPVRKFNDYRYSDNTAEGYFSVFLRGLDPNTTYHYWAFATNEAGTSYGEMKILVTAKSNNSENGK